MLQATHGSEKPIIPPLKETPMASPPNYSHSDSGYNVDADIRTNLH